VNAGSGNNRHLFPISYGACKLNVTQNEEFLVKSGDINANQALKV
jgi:hypothetical protein